MSSQSAPQPALARVFVRPIGSPLTVGISGLAVASLVESGLALHWIAASEASSAGFVLLAVPFVLQLIACVFSYLARDAAAGACIGVLATTWLALGLVHVSTGSAGRSGALGLLMLSAGAVLMLSAIAVSVANPLPGAVFLLAGARFALSGVYEIGGGVAWQHAAAIVGLVVCGIAGYCVFAFELEGQRRREVLPTFRRGLGHGDEHALDPRRLQREPGVRDST